MLAFAVDTEVNVANLNMVGDFDAIVDSSLAEESGAKYQTLAAALTAGHKNILIRPGSGAYAAVTISQSNVRVVASRRATYAEEVFGDGVYFSGLITVSGANVTISDVSVKNTGGGGFLVSGENCTLVNCAARKCAGNGVYVNAVQCRIFGGDFSNNDTADMNGVLVHNTAGRAFIVGATLDSNGSTTGSGVEVDAAGGMAHIVGCRILSNAKWGINGSNAGAFVVAVGCQVMNNATAEVNGAGVICAATANKLT